ncbi:unnamed protein product, partial [marine sediment metagenome]
EAARQLSARYESAGKREKELDADTNRRLRSLGYID